jgi:hypothetical protein
MVFLLLSGHIDSLANEASPTPDYSAYKVFPTGLVCSHAEFGPGPSWRGITIGETTLTEIKSMLEEGQSMVEFEGMLQFQLRDTSGFKLLINIRLCAENGVVKVIDIWRAGMAEALYLEDMIAELGEPDTVTYSTNPYNRLAFWFEAGTAAEIFVSQNAVGYEITEIYYFSYQSREGYENRWPYNAVLDPESGYFATTLAEGTLHEQNPFDFDEIIAPMTAQPSRTRTPTFTPRPTQTATPMPRPTSTPG